MESADGADSGVELADGAAPDGSDDAAGPMQADDAGTGDSSDGGPLAAQCVGTTDLVAGMNYEEISLFALRVDLELAPGAYSLRADTEVEGMAHVFLGDEQVQAFQYDASASLADNMLQTIAVPDYFELDVRSQTQSDLSQLDESILDGCHLIVVDASVQIEEGRQYGPILVEELTIDADAPAGTYTLHVESGNTGSVELRRDGEAVDTLAYAWMTSIGGGDSFTFEFPGLLTIGVTRAMGTSNLFALASSIFDGRHEVVVP